MSNLTAPRMQSWETWRDHRMTLASGQVVWRGSEIGLDRATGKVKKMGSDPDLLYIGTSKTDMDASAGDRVINVDFGSEFALRWWGNDATSPLTQIGQMAYALDDQTATADAGYAPVGIVWALSSVDGALIQKLPLPSSGATPAAAAVDLPPYTANNSAPADIVHGAVYDIPTTSAAVTITLPADAEDGTEAVFSADGVKNGHTVTYRDGTGNVAITTALTALKRHLVYAIMVDGTWRANAYVSP